MKKNWGAFLKFFRSRKTTCITNWIIGAAWVFILLTIAFWYAVMMTSIYPDEWGTFHSYFTTKQWYFIYITVSFVFSVFYSFVTTDGNLNFISKTTISEKAGKSIKACGILFGISTILWCLRPFICLFNILFSAIAAIFFYTIDTLSGKDSNAWGCDFISETGPNMAWLICYIIIIAIFFKWILDILIDPIKRAK